VTTRCVVRITSPTVVPRDIRRCGNLKEFQFPFIPNQIIILCSTFLGQVAQSVTDYGLDDPGSVNQDCVRCYKYCIPVIGIIYI